MSCGISVNQATENGELFNIDGNSSRVAPLLYGPQQVIIVAGVNKTVRNLVVINGQFTKGRIKVIIVKQQLGY